ncbi:MAG TPA: PH domain-containing protein [Actinoplanes sp.]|nr:PH domain-containing protein [Actinoplanes sp.]
MAGVSQKPSLRVRKSGALLVAALIAFVGALSIAGVRWELTPVLLIPLGVGLWAWRAGTDVFPDRLRIRALLGSTEVPWSRITELAPDRRGRVSALLDNGSVLRLTGVTKENLPSVLAAAGQQVDTGTDDSEISSPRSPD